MNPVAFTLDERGRVYVAETHRWQSSSYDIRGYPAWVDDDLAARSVADRLAMYRKWLGPKAETLVESERIRFLEDADGDGRAERSVVFAEGFNHPTDGLASGILARRGEIWFADIPNLWLLRDGKRDGREDGRRVLHTGYGVHQGYVGHDLHGLVLGPDGRLYFSVGDRGLHVETGGRVLDLPDTGAVLRCQPDGSDLEIYATGLRNPQELVFDAFGNLWTGDNNCDAGDRARLVYVAEGGDTGWRIGYQFMPAAGPWMAEGLWTLEASRSAPSQVPPVAHVGHGPSGFTVHPGVAALPAGYEDAFFLANFPGNVLTWKTRPRGAGFEVVDVKELLGNLWPTDVEFGPEGALYVSEWGEGWKRHQKGRLHRVFDPARLADPALLEVKRLLAEGMDGKAPAELAAWLGHADRRIRLEAQFELVRRKEAGVLESRAAAGGPLPARLQAIWGLGQLGALRPVAALLADGDAEVRAQAAKVAGELGAPPDPLLPLLGDASPRVRYFAAIALGRLRARGATGPLLDMLRENADRDAFLRHAGVMGLAGAADPEDLKRALRDPAVPVRLAALLALRRLGRPEAAELLEDPEPALVLEAARAIHDVPIEAAMPALAGLLERPSAPERALLRALNAAARTGRAAALGAFAARVDAPEALRKEALAALGAWRNPSGRDRVLGLWRPIPGRDPGEARAALGAGHWAAASPRVRAAALAALDALGDPRLRDLLAGALSDPDEGVRREVLGRTTDAAVLARAAAGDASLRLRQAALAALGRREGPEPERILGEFLEALLGGRWPAALELDLLEAASRKSGLRGLLARREAALPKDDPLAVWRPSLEGGDPEAGRRIFSEKVEAGCIKCHKVGDRGGEVGPPLAGIASKKTPEYLLEAIVLPNRQIADGFAQTVVQLRSGEVETGRVEQEAGGELRLLLADGTRKRIPLAGIQARRQGLSAMPEEAAKALGRRELRDLVAYLATLR